MNAVVCENSTHGLRALAAVELQHAAEALTALDRAGPDHGCRGRDDSLPSPWCVIVMSRVDDSMN